MSDAPTNLRALQSGRVLELTWDDGTIAQLPYHFLRGECPCASCRDEWTGERTVDPASIPAELTLAGMSGVGNYAVQFAWSDGHSSGIYTWELLRQLCRDCPFSSLASKDRDAPDA